MPIHLSGMVYLIILSILVGAWSILRILGNERQRGLQELEYRITRELIVQNALAERRKQVDQPPTVR